MVNGKVVSRGIWDSCDRFGLSYREARELIRGNFLEEIVTIDNKNGGAIRKISDRSIFYHLDRMDKDKAYSDLVSSCLSKDSFGFVDSSFDPSTGGVSYSKMLDCDLLTFEEEIFLSKKKEAALHEIGRIVFPTSYFNETLREIGEVVEGRPFLLDKYFSKFLVNKFSSEKLKSHFFSNLEKYEDLWENRPSGFEGFSYDDFSRKAYDVFLDFDFFPSVTFCAASKMNSRNWDKKLGLDVSGFDYSNFDSDVSSILKNVNVIKDVHSEFYHKNLRLVAKFAGKRGKLSDYFVDGTIGLSRAVEKYDRRMGVRFGTYAIPWIIQALENSSMNENGYLVRKPKTLSEKSFFASKIKKKFAEVNGRYPSANEFYDAYCLELGKISRFKFDTMVLGGMDFSLNVPFDGDFDLTGLDILTYDDSRLRPDSSFDSSEKVSLLNDVLSRLKPRSEEILRRRAGFFKDGPRDSETLESIGDDFSISRERVRQIEKDALNRLRIIVRSPEYSSLRDCLDDFSTK